jgi:glycosyltransferase involved in cell wall biosynthesis
MRTIKEITVFTNGNSKKIKTWSNVPFFFTTTFEKKGVKVNRIDISANKIIRELFNITVSKTLNLIYKDNSYDYFRSYIYFFFVRRKIKKAIKRYPRSDAFIFLTFSFSASQLTNKPIIQFCDWTYDHFFKYFENRKPNFFELQSVKRENSQINGSNIVFPLFPSVAKYMKEKYTSKVIYLGNVINSWHEPIEQEVLKIKKQSEKILFIGSPKYMEGAFALLKAFNTLKKHRPSLSLHFIGLRESQFGEIPNDVHCYGYLDKGEERQRELYYKLLKEAKVFVNTTPRWSAFSASIEAMYFYTPVIVPSYEEFVETFGEQFFGGTFCNDNLYLSEKIESIFNSDCYEQICRNANSLVKDFTWDSFVGKMIAEMKKL